MDWVAHGFTTVSSSAIEKWFLRLCTAGSQYIFLQFCLFCVKKGYIL